MSKLNTRMSASGKLLAALTAMLVAASLAGCESQVAGSPAAGEADLQQLAVGNYPTDPLDVRYAHQHGSLDGRALALARLADNVVIGADVDPTFGHNVLARWFDSLATAKSSQVLAGVVRPVLENNGMMLGFSAAASTRELPKTRQRDRSGNFSPFDGAEGDPEATAFNVTVLQFPDQQRAQAAADQMEAADFAVAADQNVRVVLNKQKSAKAHWRPGVPSMAGTLAYGQYVVNVYAAQPKPDQNSLSELVEKVFAAQLPLLDRAPALSPHDIFRLDYDPDAMLRRTLHPGYFHLDPKDEATHTPRGLIHFVDDQATWKKLFDDNGVDRISTASNGGLLMRASDATAAASLWSGIKGSTGGSAESPAHVPDVFCNTKTTEASGVFWSAYDVKSTGTVYVCTLHYDRYVAQVASPQLTDVQQRAAAQYALLANSQYM